MDPTIDGQRTGERRAVVATPAQEAAKLRFELGIVVDKYIEGSIDNALALARQILMRAQKLHQIGPEHPVTAEAALASARCERIFGGSSISIVHLRESLEGLRSTTKGVEEFASFKEYATHQLLIADLCLELSRSLLGANSPALKQGRYPLLEAKALAEESMTIRESLRASNLIAESDPGYLKGKIGLMYLAEAEADKGRASSYAKAVLSKTDYRNKESELYGDLWFAIELADCADCIACQRMIEEGTRVTLREHADANPGKIRISEAGEWIQIAREIRATARLCDEQGPFRDKLHPLHIGTLQLEARALQVRGEFHKSHERFEEAISFAERTSQGRELFANTPWAIRLRADALLAEAHCIDDVKNYVILNSNGDPKTLSETFEDAKRVRNLINELRDSHPIDPITKVQILLSLGGVGLIHARNFKLNDASRPQVLREADDLLSQASKTLMEAFPFDRFPNGTFYTGKVKFHQAQLYGLKNDVENEVGLYVEACRAFQAAWGGRHPFVAYLADKVVEVYRIILRDKRKQHTYGPSLAKWSAILDEHKRTGIIAFDSPSSTKA